MPKELNEALFDRGVSHAAYLQRYSTGVVRRMMSLLNEVDQDLVERILAKEGETFTKHLLQQILKDVRTINAEAVKEFQSRLDGEIRDFGAYEAAFHASTLQDEIPIKWNINQPSPAQVYAAVVSTPFDGKILSEEAVKWGEHKKGLIEAAIRKGWVEGQDIPGIARRIRGTRKNRYEDGILQTSRRNAETLVRTAINHTANIARHETFKENEDVIKGVEYVATLDSRTSLQCASLDGKVFPLEEGPRPPQHYNCRSTTVPVVKSWRELGIDLDEAPEGTRASMNGQVPASRTFEQWLRNQPTYVQKEVLGPNRFKLFDDGAPIGKFLKDGRVLTLKELGIKDSQLSPRERTERLVVPDFKKVSEAGPWAVKHGLADMSDFSGVPVDVAKEWLQELADQRKELGKLLDMKFTGVSQAGNKILKDALLPEIKKKAEYFYPDHPRRQKSYITKSLNRRIPRVSGNAWFIDHDQIGGISMNKNNLKIGVERYNEIHKLEQKSKWSSLGGPGIKHLINHELGHVLDNRLKIRELPRISELYNELSKSGRFVEELSRYPVEGKHRFFRKKVLAEMIAEAWAEYRTSPRPRPVAKEIGEIIMEEVRKWQMKN